MELMPVICRDWELHTGDLRDPALRCGGVGIQGPRVGPDLQTAALETSELLSNPKTLNVHELRNGREEERSPGSNGKSSLRERCF